MERSGRSYSGFNPASGPDVKLFQAVLDGNNLVRGFRNADIREALNGATDDSLQRRRQSAAVGQTASHLDAENTSIEERAKSLVLAVGGGGGLEEGPGNVS